LPASNASSQRRTSPTVETTAPADVAQSSRSGGDGARPHRRQRRFVCDETRLRHTGAFEDVRSYVMLVRIVRGELDDAAEQDVVRVAVLPARAGREVERLRRHARDQRRIRRGLRAREHLHVVADEKFRNAGHLFEQLTHRDAATGEIIRDVRSEPRVERQLPRLDELQDARRGDLLRDRTDLEARVRGDGNVLRHVREAVAAREHDAAVLGDADREARHVLSGEHLRGHTIGGRGSRIGGRRRRLGRRAREGRQRRENGRDDESATRSS
jgi:hypothetical protein